MQEYELLVRRMQELGPLVGVLIVVVLVAVIVALIRGIAARIDVGGQRAIEVLNKPHAAGKSSIEEHEERKQKAAGAG